MANTTTGHRDPVCGMTVVEEKAAGKSEYGGHTYYFCGASWLGEVQGRSKPLCRAPGGRRSSAAQTVHAISRIHVPHAS